MHQDDQGPLAADEVNEELKEGVDGESLRLSAVDERIACGRAYLVDITEWVYPKGHL